MADKEVGDLTAAATLTGAELAHIIQGGNSRQTTTQDIADLASGGGGGGAGAALEPFKGALIYNAAASNGENFSGAGLVFDYFDTASYDEGGWADLGGDNPERFTVPAGVSKVKVKAHISLEDNGTGGSVLVLQKNGSGLTPAIQARFENVGSQARGQISSGTLEVVPGDYFSVLCISEDSSTDVAINSSWFYIEAVGPSSLEAFANLDAGGTAAANALILQDLIDGGVKNIQMPAGTFPCDQIYLASGVKLRGSSGQTKLQHPTKTITDDAAYGGVVNAHGTALNPIVGVVLEDFTVDGNKANITTAGSTDDLNIECVDFRYAEDCHTYRVEVIDSFSDGFDYDNCKRCHNYDCVARDCDGYGNHFSQNSEDCKSFGLYAEGCGVVHTRGGFDTHSSSTGCGYIAPKTTLCHRGGYIAGDSSFVTDHEDDASIGNSLRLAGANGTFSGRWKNTSGGNGITMESGASNNQITGIIDGASSGGLRLLSGANENTVRVTSINNTTDGILVNSDRNIFSGSISRGNGGSNYLVSGGVDNVQGDMVT